MADPRYFVILNPAADRGGAQRAWRGAGAVLDAAGVEYELATTEGPRHAEALAADAAAAGYSAVVAVGGDGTVQEVANGLMHAADGGPTVPMGIIGQGTGNDFIKVAGLPRNQPAEAARRLLAAVPRQVDIGRVGQRFFTNGVGVGFDARVAIEASRIKRLRGISIYAWALVKVLRSHRTPQIRIVIDGEEIFNRRATLVNVSNGGCHGGAFWICPQARIDDGMLDVCIADALEVPQILRLIPSLMRGTHTGKPPVHMYRARHVHISSSEPLPVHADGEILTEAAHELEFELLPGRLTLLA